MVLLQLPSEILQTICSYLDEIDVRRLSRTCSRLRRALDQFYRPRRKRLTIDDKHSLRVYAHLLSKFRWTSVDDQLGVFTPPHVQRLFEINGQQNEICNRACDSHFGCDSRRVRSQQRQKRAVCIVYDDHRAVSERCRIRD